jgi:hypothetical protein
MKMSYNREIRDKTELSKIVDVVRAKYLALKLGDRAAYDELNKQYEPLSASLGKTVGKAMEPLAEIAEKIADKLKPKLGVAIPAPPQVTRPSSTSTPRPRGSRIHTPAGKITPLTFAHTIRMKTPVASEDHVYGISYKNHIPYMNGHQVVWKPNGIKIGSKDFPRTDGLTSLLTFNVPLDYDDADLRTYEDILVYTGTGFNKYGKVKTSKSTKYLDVVRDMKKRLEARFKKEKGDTITFEIDDGDDDVDDVDADDEANSSDEGAEVRGTFRAAPHPKGFAGIASRFRSVLSKPFSTPSETTPSVSLVEKDGDDPDISGIGPIRGEGVIRRRQKRRGKTSTVPNPKHRRKAQFMELARPPRSEDYIYWNDPNELVERLQLLRASKRAGNTGLVNEIANIEEELREEGYIR